MIHEDRRYIPLGNAALERALGRCNIWSTKSRSNSSAISRLQDWSTSYTIVRLINTQLTEKDLDITCTRAKVLAECGRRYKHTQPLEHKDHSTLPSNFEYIFTSTFDPSYRRTWHRTEVRLRSNRRAGVRWLLSGSTQNAS